MPSTVMDWTERHAKFFLLLTMVFGGLSGVAIWVIISLTSPAATSLLVREFLYGWATEWCFFVGEIVALLLYSAGFAKVRSGAMSHETHRKFGLAYAVFSFLSLFVINGIVSFMLTPGYWPQTRNFWDGFFNPTFWPALVFRFLLCLALAGVFGLPFSSATVSHIQILVFGALIMFFLIVEPHGLARLWQIAKEKLRLWPFPH